MSSSAPVGARFSVRLISAHSVDSRPSLLVVFDQARYLFNAPENTSRICVSSKVGVRKVHAVFLDALELSTGLPGLILSTVEAGNNQLEVVGPTQTEQLIATCRYFTRRERLSLKITSAPPLSSTITLPPPSFTDSNLIVHALPLYAANSHRSLKRKRSLSRSPSPSTDTNGSTSYDPTAPDFRPSHLTGAAAVHWRQRVLDDMFQGKAFPPPSSPSALPLPELRPSPAYLLQPLPSCSSSSLLPETLSYLAIGPPVRGTFLPDKAKGLGVPQRKFRNLTRGERVWVPVLPTVQPMPQNATKAQRKAFHRARTELEDSVVDGEGEGWWVEPNECMTPAQDASAFLVLNIPSIDYLDALASLPSTLLTDLPSARLDTVFYLLGPFVLSDPRLTAFISFLPSTISHRIVSPETSSNPLTFIGSSNLTAQLSLLSPIVFPPHQAIPAPVAPVVPENTTVLLLPPPPSLPPIPAAYEKAVQALDLSPPPAVSHPGHDLLVTPLGTGSAIPSKYRNVSSTLLHLPLSSSSPRTQYILLDAGEGTWGQLCRRFGDEVCDVLRDIEIIFISHMHQDHHAGLATILRERHSLNPLPRKPLLIIAPPQVRIYLFERQALFDLGLGDGREIQFVDNWALEPARKLEPDDIRNDVMNKAYERLGLEAITTVAVLHRAKAWGLVISHRTGWRVVFSGDTMPCDALIEAGKGATLLIHEATMDDELPEVAAAKGHSTFGQAIEVARRMEATYVLLTHFSARYPKLPPLIHKPPPVVALAFDLMTLRLDQFWMAHQFLPALDVLFAVDGGEEAEE